MPGVILVLFGSIPIFGHMVFGHPKQICHKTKNKFFKNSILRKKFAKNTSDENITKATSAQNKLLKYTFMTSFRFCVSDVKIFNGRPLN